MKKSDRDSFLYQYRKICSEYEMVIDVFNGELRLFTLTSQVPLDAHIRDLLVHSKALTDEPY